MRHLKALVLALCLSLLASIAFAASTGLEVIINGVHYPVTQIVASPPVPPVVPTPSKPIPGTPLTSMKENLRYQLMPGYSDLYVGKALSAGYVGFIDATKDWTNEADMVAMYGGANCEQGAPTIADYQAIKSSKAIYSGTGGVKINGRVFYWDFSDLYNQQVSIGSFGKPSAPAGCYYALIVNAGSAPANYSLTFTATGR